MDYAQRLKLFRQKRLDTLAKTSIADADNKIARMDQIDKFLWIRALAEISDNLIIYDSLTKRR